MSGNNAILVNMSEPKHRQMLIGWLHSLRGLHRITVKAVKRGRSLQQNAFYWAVIIPHVRAGLAEAWGEELDVTDVHEYLKAKFLSRAVVNRTTGVIVGERPGSSARLNVSDFCEYLDKIIRFAAEDLNTEIPAAESFTAKS